MKSYNYFFKLIILIFIIGCSPQENEEATFETSTSLSSQLDNTEISRSDNTSTIFGLEAENQFYLMNKEKSELYVMAKVVGGENLSEAKRTPLNISLVIDRSGSMSSENKLKNVKEACKLVINNLTNKDKLSLVAYDDRVRVLQKSDFVVQKTILEDKVDKVESGGSTNLSGGMLKGFAQVSSTYEDNAVNRVLLLSDGLANKGVTDVGELQKIVQKKYNNDRIGISTFGVGVNFNEDLMTNLAEYGKGNYYFINSSDEIPGIFKEELDGLLSVVAQNTILEFEYQNDYLEIEKVYGYEFEKEGNKLIIDYNDVFAKEEKIILLKFKIKEIPSYKDLVFNASLTYDDVLSDYERITKKDRLEIGFTSDLSKHEESVNMEVQRNIIMFTAIDNFEQAAKKIDEGEYDKAKEIMKYNIEYMKNNEKIDIESDTALLEQFENYTKYSNEIDDIEKMRSEEKKMLQKENKSMNYKLKKKKK